MPSLKTICFLLAVSSALAFELPAVDEEEVRGSEHMPYELFGNYGSHRESLASERKINSQEEPFSWLDCGGSGSLFHLKSLSVSPVPFHLPGNITVAFSATIDEDIEGPISVSMRVKKKIGAIWMNVCKYIPGGCEREDICNILLTPTASAAAAEGFEDTALNSFCPLRKGDFSLPPTPFFLTTKVPSGWYKVTAIFIKEKKRIACVYVKLKMK